MRTTKYPIVKFEEHTYEINEFDCASMYLLEGSEYALLIDCGIGLGDLQKAVEKITDKPILTVITHGHYDHTGNAGQFPEIWMNKADWDLAIPGDFSTRKSYVQSIYNKYVQPIGEPFDRFPFYPYDLERDLVEKNAAI